MARFFAKFTILATFLLSAFQPALAEDVELDSQPLSSPYAQVNGRLVKVDTLLDKLTFRDNPNPADIAYQALSAFSGNYDRADRDVQVEVVLQVLKLLPHYENANKYIQAVFNSENSPNSMTSLDTLNLVLIKLRNLDSILEALNRHPEINNKSSLRQQVFAGVETATHALVSQATEILTSDIMENEMGSQIIDENTSLAKLASVVETHKKGKEFLRHLKSFISPELMALILTDTSKRIQLDFPSMKKFNKENYSTSEHLLFLMKLNWAMNIVAISLTASAALFTPDGHDVLKGFLVSLVSIYTAGNLLTAGPKSFKKVKENIKDNYVKFLLKNQMYKYIVSGCHHFLMGKK